MKPQDFLKDIEDTTKNLVKDHKKLITDFQKDPTKVKIENHSFVETKEKVYDLPDAHSFEKVQEMINDMASFMKEVEEFKDYPNFQCTYDVETESGYESAYIDTNCLRASWYAPSKIKLEEFYTQLAKKYAKTKVENELRPSMRSQNSPRQIDCKFMTLWIEEKIDWETLQQIVYSDCKL